MRLLFTQALSYRVINLLPVLTCLMYHYTYDLPPIVDINSTLSQFLSLKLVDDLLHSVYFMTNMQTNLCHQHDMTLY